MKRIGLFVLRVVAAVMCAAMGLSACAAGEGIPPSAGSVGVWWWNGRQVGKPAEYLPRLDFLASNRVTEIYFAVDHDAAFKDLSSFIAAAQKRGMRVAWLSGDVSWIYPGSLGFDEVLGRFVAYQKSVPENLRFYALHLDVEPHQDHDLTDARKWQLYADFVLRAAANVRRRGYKIEWDIPFWLDNIRVPYGKQADAPLLDVMFASADTLTLMSYRDTAKAMLETGSGEVALAKTRPCRIVFGAETGETGEGNAVSFYEEGKAHLNQELAKVRESLAKEGLPGGFGVAIHHLGSWIDLKE